MQRPCYLENPWHNCDVTKKTIFIKINIYIETLSYLHTHILSSIKKALLPLHPLRRNESRRNGGVTEVTLALHVLV